MRRWVASLLLALGLFAGLSQPTFAGFSASPWRPACYHEINPASDRVGTKTVEAHTRVGDAAYRANDRAHIAR